MFLPLNLVIATQCLTKDASESACTIVISFRFFHIVYDICGAGGTTLQGAPGVNSDLSQVHCTINTYHSGS